MNKKVKILLWIIKIILFIVLVALITPLMKCIGDNNFYELCLLLSYSIWAIFIAIILYETK